MELLKVVTFIKKHTNQNKKQKSVGNLHELQQYGMFQGFPQEIG